ncbi:MAG: hypothetical protein D8M58_10310 [Calditrichaeota bacterium]|nr:MAG: hypothetical protein DWQ03_09685 [Calditrichota bacterium]MBL1205782.1 hypothetical protein [Calditrichota bacterium]NOG45610.1 SpoIIE family protein phosphatase [Calditrichota bacterium]
MAKFLKIIVSLFLLLMPLFAQAPKNNFVHLSIEDGLPSNNVFNIFQDRFGYIWIGTLNGLSRYDGYEYKNYHPEIENDASIQSNIIVSFYEDRVGDLWIGGLGGLNKYIRESDSFRFYSLSDFAPDSGSGYFHGLTVTAISEDNDGNMWLGVGLLNWDTVKDGLFYLDKESEEIKKYEFSDNFNSQNILTFLVSKKGEFWFGGYRGLGRLNPITHKINFFRAPNSTENFGVNSILEDKKGLLWLGTHENGLQSFNPIDTVFKQYPIQSLKNETGSSDISGMFFDESDNLWLATSSGLMYFNPKTENVQYLLPDKDNPASISFVAASSIIGDFAGSIWIGGWENGLNRYDPVRTEFHAYTNNPSDPKSYGPAWATFFAEDHKKNIWIGSDQNFISRFNRKDKNFTKFPINGNNNLSGYISSAFEDSKKRLWIGIGGHLFNLNSDYNGFSKAPVMQQFGSNIIHDFYEDENGILWFGREDGLFSYNQSNNSIKHFTFDSFPSTSFESNRIYRLTGDKNNIWIGTNRGLFKYEQQTGRFSRIGFSDEKNKSLSDHDINSLYIDKSGILWIGTWFGGLNRYDPQSGIVNFYTRKNGLATNSIQGILGDEENGFLWLSTYAGITRFDLNKEQFLNFNIKDGVHSTEFVDGAAFKTSKGEFLFGGASGFTMFKSEDIKENVTPPRVFISDFKLSNKSVIPGPDAPLKKSIYDASEITLGHDQNDISFEFLAIHFIKSERNQYAYMLENYESDWRNVGSQRTAIYPNLPPGNYNFRVKAANFNNYWNEEGASIKVTINYPWWRSSWAYVLYILLFAGLVFVFDRFQRRRLLAKERAASEIKEAKLRAQVAEAENERKSKELEEARQLQLSMLPKELPQLPHLDIAVYMQTATEVGGDYYDFHVGLDGTLTVVIGDATGHGMKAGTMVTAAKSLFNSYAPNPDILFSFHEFTRCIKKMNFGKLSMCLTMLKFQGNKVTFSAAGMPPAYVYSKKKKTVEENLFKGMPLGTMEKFPYEIKETALNVGDTLLLMSDGLPELQNNNGEQFGYQRIHDLFLEVAENSSEEIIERLKNNGKSWVNDEAPDDDVTFVVIKVK